MLDTVGSQVSSARDKVSWRADGSWKLQEENKLRYSTKRKSATSSTLAKDDDVIELLWVVLLYESFNVVVEWLNVQSVKTVSKLKFYLNSLTIQSFNLYEYVLRAH